MSLSEKIWAGNYTGPEGALAQHEVQWRVMTNEERREVAIARASLFYSAAIRTLLQWERSKWNVPALVRGISYLNGARRLCVRALVRKNLTADELDVIQTIFRRTSRLPFLYQDIHHAACALTRASTMDNLPIHTIALLRLGHLDLAIRTGVAQEGLKELYLGARAAFVHVLQELTAAGFPGKGITELSPQSIQLGRQAARIARGLAEVACVLGAKLDQLEFSSTAREFSAHFNTPDQAFKAQ